MYVLISFMYVLMIDVYLVTSGKTFWKSYSNFFWIIIPNFWNRVLKIENQICAKVVNVIFCRSVIHGILHSGRAGGINGIGGIFVW